MKNPLTGIHYLLLSSRNFLYDQEILDQVRVSVPVISVGNLSMGGTGKTPVINYLLEQCRKLNIRAAVVSRNYKGKSKQTEIVDYNRKDGASFYGDEPFMLASQNRDFYVVVGRDKWKSAKLIDSRKKVDVIFVDDGFQHRQLFRDFDMVLVDSSRPLEDLKLFPTGRGREGLDALSRASVLLLTRWNLASAENIKFWNDYSHRLQEKFQIPTLTVESELILPTGKLGIEGSLKKCMLVSAIGNPDSFEQELSLAIGSRFMISGHLRYADHYQYQKNDVQVIADRAKEVGADIIFTTEKDMVKLDMLDRGLKNVVAVQQRLFISDKKGTINEILKSVIR